MNKIYTKDKPLSLLRLLAFTLAEVIIVLGIVGVVAEMTIPTLFRNTQKQETIIRLKKTITMLNQIIQMNIGDENMLQAPVSNDTTDTASLDAFFAPKLQKIKTCTGADATCGLTDTWCLHKTNQGIAMPSTATRYILKDGTSIGFWGNGGTYKVYVDINGPGKSPNRMGYDVFMIRINPTSITRPATVMAYAGWMDLNSYNNDGQGCDTPPYQASGQYCFYRIMFDNWEIKYWY